jgi:pimeloyl-ACP methyl ester carboxylesterase
MLVAVAPPSGARAESEDERKQACANPDMRSRVVGDKFCLVIRTYGTQTAGPSPTLVVVLHGDGDSAGYHNAIARGLARPGVVAVGLIRPGYTSKDDRTSDGMSTRFDHYTAENVDAVADAVARLKGHHKAREAVLIGHSGGAAIAGVIIGRHPGVVERALLISCPCDIPRWRDMKRRDMWFSSLSPQDHADKVPATAKVIAITGDRDDNTDPDLARDYVAKLAARGVVAKFVAVPGSSHNLNRKMRETDEIRQALNDIVSGNF